MIEFSFERRCLADERSWRGCLRILLVLRPGARQWIVPDLNLN